MTRQLNIKDAINEALHQEMAADERIIIFGEDIAGGAGRDEEHPEAADAWGGPFGVTKGLLPKFGRERVIDTAIAETGLSAPPWARPMPVCAPSPRSCTSTSSAPPRSAPEPGRQDALPLRRQMLIPMVVAPWPCRFLGGAEHSQALYSCTPTCRG